MSRVGRRAAEIEGRACAKTGRQRLWPDLVVQRLRLHASIPGGLVQSQVRELRSCKHDLVNHRVECLGDLLCVGTRQEGVRLRSQAVVRSPKPPGCETKAFEFYLLSAEPLRSLRVGAGCWNVHCRS